MVDGDDGAHHAFTTPTNSPTGSIRAMQSSRIGVPSTAGIRGGRRRRRWPGASPWSPPTSEVLAVWTQARQSLKHLLNRIMKRVRQSERTGAAKNGMFLDIPHMARLPAQSDTHRWHGTLQSHLACECVQHHKHWE